MLVFCDSKVVKFSLSEFSCFTCFILCICVVVNCCFAGKLNNRMIIIEIRHLGMHCIVI